MGKYKFEDFIKRNSKEIYGEDLVTLKDDSAEFEQLLSQAFKKKSKSPVYYMRYWAAAAVLIVGAIIISHIHTDKEVNVGHVENYLVTVNNKIDSLVEKVEAIDKVEHAGLIQDLKQLRKDNLAFIESSRKMESEPVIIDLKKINEQQMLMLASLEENIDKNLVDSK